MPWLLVVVVLAMALVAFGARLGSVLDDAAQARTAADAAALAGASRGAAAAHDLAAANGGEVVEFRRTASGVEVVVRVGEVVARAEATATATWQRFDPPD